MQLKASPGAGGGAGAGGALRGTTVPAASTRSPNPARDSLTHPGPGHFSLSAGGGARGAPRGGAGGPRRPTRARRSPGAERVTRRAGAIKHLPGSYRLQTQHGSSPGTTGTAGEGGKSQAKL